MREAVASDLMILEDALYAAANWTGEQRFTREQIMADPALVRYMSRWPRPGDFGVIAETDDGADVGAAWCRLFPTDEQGYGFVAEDIPELTIGVLPMYRGRGVGAALMQALIARARADGLRAISLSVEDGNRARAPYERLGFAKVGRNGGSDTLLLDLATSKAIMDTDFAGVFINGTVGAGKTTTAGALSRLLVEDRVPHATIDLDALRDCWPAPPSDPFNLELELLNLAAVAANYRSAGIPRFVVAGVIEDASEIPRYEHALGGRLFVCRLRVPQAVLEERLKFRHDDDDVSRTWHLNRSGELQAILEEAGNCGVTIDAGMKTPQELAVIIRRLAWWERARSQTSSL